MKPAHVQFMLRHSGQVLISAIAALLLLGSAACTQSHVGGFWVLNVSRGDGTDYKTFFELKPSGHQVGGSVWIDYYPQTITEGSVSGDKLHVVVGRNPQDRVTADGAMEGDRLHLHIHFPDRPDADGLAERTTPQAVAPPARLPVPQLHDVRDNGLARTPPMGWNSWNKFAGKVDDAAVRGMADAMVASGMKAAGYTYVNIDDTWQGDRDAQGNITSNRKFPDMKALADYVHSKGLKIGIYSSPGPQTCAGYEGSYGHEEQDAKTYAAWGYDYLKYDWCSADRVYKPADLQPVYQKMGDALLATGRPIVFSLCEYGMGDVWKWGAKVGGNLWRTTGDIDDTWKGMEQIGFRQFDIASYAQVGHWNDPDMLEIGNGGMTADEYRTHMSLWSLLAAPLLAGNDLRTMTPETKSILMNKEVIAIDQDPAATPVKKISEQGALVVAARPLHDGSTVVGLFNRGDAPAIMTVSWSALGLHGASSVRDLWAHKELAKTADSFAAEVPSHGVVLIKVKR